MLFFLCNYICIIFGIVINAAVLLVIALRTPSALKDYSIILLYTTLNDLSAMLLHMSLNPRLFITDSVIAHMANGPCQNVSQICCEILFELFHYTFMNAISLIGISFWYRKRALHRKGSVGWCKLQSIILSSFAVHLPHMIVYFLAMSPREQLASAFAEIYGSQPDAYIIFGFITNFSSPSLFYTIFHFLMYPMIIYPYIFSTRKAVLAALAARAEMMTSRTRETHHSLVTVLSIHAVLPSCTLLGYILLFSQLTNIYHSIEVETVIYTIPVFPSILNPILTLYFIKPYKM